MKKAISTFFVFISTCLLAFNLFGQEMKVDTQLTKVIANGGLRLREKPGTSSKILTTIPFGEKVKYRSVSSFGTDSIGYTDERSVKNWVHGNWVKVKWKNLTGFVLDSYLFYEPYQKTPGLDSMNKDYRFLFPGCHCEPQSLIGLSGWKFYGYFGDSTNGLTRKPVTVRYLRSDDVIFCGYIVDIQPAKGLQFAIAGKDDSGFAQHIPWMNWRYLSNSYSNTSAINKELQALSLEIKPPPHDRTGDEAPQLYLNKKGIRQLLSPGEFWEPSIVIYCGDLDNDRQNDYIITFGDKGGGVVLFLSSKSRPGELVRPVAVFFISYCC